MMFLASVELSGPFSRVETLQNPLLQSDTISSDHVQKHDFIPFSLSRQKDIYREREREEQTDRQKDKQIGTETLRGTDRHTQ